MTDTARWFRRSLTVLAIVTAAVVTSRAQQGPRDLFERARLAEENSRTLGRAVELYDQVVAQAAGDRALAATAELHKALVLERQGKAEAGEAFASIIRRYPDQPAVVAAARTRVDATKRRTTRQGGPIPRSLYSDETFPTDVSPDGRYAVVTTNETPTRLALRDLATGQLTTLVQGTSKAWGQQAVFSSDGRQVIYRYLTDAATAGAAVGIADVASGTAARLINTPVAFGGSPIGVSSDRREVLLYRPSVSATAGAQLEWMSIASGASRIIKTFEPWRKAGVPPMGGIRCVSLSPDGQTIAFSALARPGSDEQYIFALDAEGQNETAIVKIAGVSREPKWTADSGRLVFVNERSGVRGLWTVPVRHTQPAGEPSLVQNSFGGDLVSLTPAGDLFSMATTESGFSEFVAERNPAGSPIVQTFKGQSGTWSLGNRLAFIRPGQGGPDMIVRSMGTGEERTYRQPGGFTNQSPRWFHDDSALLVFLNPDPGSQPGGAFYRLDVATGTMTFLFARTTPDHQRSSGVLISQDDKVIYAAVRANAQSAWTHIVAVDLATGVQRTVLALPNGGFVNGSGPGFSLSPDGKTIAMNVPVPGANSPSRIFTFGVDGSNLHQVNTYNSSHWVDWLRWTPDGQSLLFVVQPVDRQPWRMMRIPATGGAAEFDGLDSSAFVSTVPLPKMEIGNIANFEVSPDGRRVVFGERTIPTYELTVQENLALILTR